MQDEENIKHFIDQVIAKIDNTKYAEFLETDSKNQLLKYKYEKNWNNDLCDILPFLSAEVLDKTIIIVKIESDNNVNITIINEEKIDPDTTRIVALREKPALLDSQL